MNRSMNCVVCGKVLFGRIVMDSWNNHYCAAHLQEYPQCKACQRLVCERLTGGGVKYNDGRVVCNICRKKAIDSKEQARPVVENAATFLSNLGLRFRGLTLKVTLGNSIEFNKIAFGDRSSLTGPGQGQIMGLIHKVSEYQNDVDYKRKVSGVSVLHGLPKGLFQGVVTHELGHAWIFLAKIDALPVWEEEGFCNFLSYLLYKNQPVPDAEHWIKILEDDPDPVYGEGFRKVRRIFLHFGFEEAIHQLYENKILPSLEPTLK